MKKLQRRPGRLRWLRLRAARTGARSRRPPSAARPTRRGTCRWSSAPSPSAYKVDGVDSLVLDAETIAKIFNGAVKKWNDPAIAALNGGATLPDKDITVDLPLGRVGHHRQLPEVPEAPPGGVDQGCRQAVRGWRRRGRGEVRRCRAGRRRHRRCDHLRRVVLRRRTTSCSIAKIDSGAGAVELTAETAGKAIDGAKFKGEGNDLILDLDSIYGYQGRRRVPADARDLRDRLLEGLRRRHRQGRQGVPHGRRHRRSGAASPTPATCRCPTAFQEQAADRRQGDRLRLMRNFGSTHDAMNDPVVAKRPAGSGDTRSRAGRRGCCHRLGGSDSPDTGSSSNPTEAAHVRPGDRIFRGLADGLRRLHRRPDRRDRPVPAPAGHPVARARQGQLPDQPRVDHHRRGEPALRHPRPAAGHGRGRRCSRC